MRRPPQLSVKTCGGGGGGGGGGQLGCGAGGRQEGGKGEDWQLGRGGGLARNPLLPMHTSRVWVCPEAGGYKGKRYFRDNSDILSLQGRKS